MTPQRPPEPDARLAHVIKTLSPTMVEALVACYNHGLVRRRGGFWMRPSDDPASAMFPRNGWSAGVRTLLALETRELVKLDHPHYNEGSKCRLTPSGVRVVMHFAKHGYPDLHDDIALDAPLIVELPQADAGQPAETSPADTVK